MENSSAFRNAKQTPRRRKTDEESAPRVGKVKFPLYFCPWKDGRVVDRGGLENR